MRRARAAPGAAGLPSAVEYGEHAADQWTSDELLGLVSKARDGAPEHGRTTEHEGGPDGSTSGAGGS
ncbi:hypothetical protein [Actinomadura algeriensis]|uniref:Uncharacterized protein n=1 Tax=Actinomadura algeriensis TaxID=1679523 RepID=A0ABR9JPC1_9ACTN|nr:hypothetical protein [Actinomadura algeriensis]MBE1532419.1 hypothetical protein [Actinomadura algeriensis]